MLQRFQIYLDSDTVRVLDKISEKRKTSRAQLIRQAIDQSYQKEKKQFRHEKAISQPNLLLKLIGIGVSKTGKVSENIDEIYQ